MFFLSPPFSEEMLLGNNNISCNPKKTFGRINHYTAAFSQLQSLLTSLGPCKKCLNLPKIFNYLWRRLISTLAQVVSPKQLFIQTNTHAIQIPLKINCCVSAVGVFVFCVVFQYHIHDNIFNIAFSE